jgi:hypothetical protein
MESPIRVKELGNMAPEISAAQISPKSDTLSSKAVLGSFICFQGKQWIPKLEIISWHTTWTPNLHYLESEHSRYVAGKEGLRRIRKIWMRLSLWKSSLFLSQGRFRARKGGARPKSLQVYKHNPLGAPRGGPIEILSPESRRKEIHRRKPTAAASLRGYLEDGLGHPSRHGLPARLCHGGIWESPPTFVGVCTHTMVILMHSLSCLYFGLLQCMLSSSYVMHPYVHSKIRSIHGD